MAGHRVADGGWEYIVPREPRRYTGKRRHQPHRIRAILRRADGALVCAALGCLVLIGMVAGLLDAYPTGRPEGPLQPADQPPGVCLGCLTPSADAGDPAPDRWVDDRASRSDPSLLPRSPMGGSTMRPPAPDTAPSPHPSPMAAPVPADPSSAAAATCAPPLPSIPLPTRPVPTRPGRSKKPRPSKGPP